MNKLVAAVLAKAQADLDAGVRERPRGSNSGPRVNQYLANTGLRPGFAWCAAAAVTWLKEALGGRNPVPMTADCDVLLFWSRRRKLSRTRPTVGALALRLKAGDRDDADHVGIVKALRDGEFLLLAGNTNDEGSREGYEVAEKWLPLSSRWEFVEWFDLFDSDEAETSGSALVGSTRLPLTFPNGTAFVGLRALLAAFYGSEEVSKRLTFADGAPLWNGAGLPFEVSVVNGESRAPLRVAASWRGTSVVWNPETKVATVGVAGRSVSE